MRVTSLFAFILVSTTLLSESHHAGAIGVDSSSHGLVYGGRVVRRYGALYRRLQERAGDPKGQDANKVQDAIGIPTKVKPENNKIPDKVPDNNNNKTPAGNNNKTPENKAPTPDNDNKPPAPPAVPANKPPAPPAPPAPPVAPVAPTNKPPAPQTPPTVKTPAQPTTTPTTTPPKANVSKKELGPGKDDTTDTTLDSTSDQDADETAQAGTPTVATGPLSSSAVGGLASVGGIFVLVGGLFAFSQRKKNKEMTKSIVSNSAKAWEQQSSTYEVLEEETKPLGTFAVVATYTPTLSDELDIQPGDKVTILVEYDDGWVQGINETRGGIKGVFPRHCVDMSQPTNKINKSSKRSSSMGGGYTEVDLS